MTVYLHMYIRQYNIGNALIFIRLHPKKPRIEVVVKLKYPKKVSDKQHPTKSIRQSPFDPARVASSHGMNGA